MRLLRSFLFLLILFAIGAPAHAQKYLGDFLNGTAIKGPMALMNLFDRDLLVSSIEEHNLKRFDVSTGQYYEVVLPNFERAVFNSPRQIILSPDWYIYALLDSSSVQVFDSAVGGFIKVLFPADDSRSVHAMAFDPDGNLVTLNKGKEATYTSIERYDVTTGERMEVIVADTIGLDGTFIAFDEAGKLYVSDKLSQSILRFKEQDGAQFSAVITDSTLYDVSTFIFDDAGDLFIGSNVTTDVYKYSVSTGKRLGVLTNDLEDRRGATGSLVFNPEGYLLATWPTKNLIGYFDVEGISGVSIEDERRDFLDVKLNANFPNPFVGTTTISFSTSADQYVELTLYDVLGITRRRLLEKSMPAGLHSISTDLSNLAAGVYFYQLKTESVVLTRRMVLLD